MRESIKNLVNGKKVLIVGFGREGRSIYKLLKDVKGYSELAIADKLATNFGIDEKVYSGDNYLDIIKDFDIVFKSPGVVIDKTVDKGNAIITSMIEQFLKVYRKQIIGITGTKGKSTVSSLIYHTLKNNGKKVIFAGNIGVPVFDVIDEIEKDTNIVIELSCHQLENCKYSPHIAVFLNIYEDHLDHYENFDAYYNAKKNIYLNQDADDILYCIDMTRPKEGTAKSKIQIIEKENSPFTTFEEIGATNFRGEHNVLNCAFAYNIVKEYGISSDKFVESVKTFKTLPHRLELIGKVKGIEYFDDSISTTAESCISAIKSITNISTILIGGMDRGINYDGLIEFLIDRKVKNVILMYASGNRIYDKVKDLAKGFDIYCVEDLEKAVEIAKKVTGVGCACVMSPAAASYGYFKNFEERGDKYKSLVYKE